MGAGNSTLSDLPSNNYLKRFVSSEIINSNDPFYNQLLSFQIKLPNTIADNRLLEESFKPLFTSLLHNSSTTGNIASLIQVFLAKATELKASVQLENKVFTWQTCNALFLLRCVVKCLLETESEENVIMQLQISPKSMNSKEDLSNLVERFICSLVEIIVDVPLSSLTHDLHWEATSTLIVLTSSHIFAVASNPRYLILKTLMTGKPAIHACLFTKSLISRVISKQLVDEDQGGSSLILGIASGLWNVLKMGVPDIEDDEVKLPRLSLQSLLLTLILVHHCPSSKSNHNPYRTALLNAQNAQDAAQCFPVEAVATFKVDYPSLFSTLQNHLSSDLGTLLLYILLHKNTHFRTYVLSRTDIETMVLPILRVLYEAPAASSHHIYMSLIILLILSEDDSYNKTIHDISVSNISWYNEKPLSQISLGGLLILVVIRTITLNMAEMRDKYLHTNCLAALANMSSQFQDLHPYVCDRIVTLFEILARRHMKLRQALTHSALSTINTDDETLSEKVNDVGVLEEVLRMVLEILNSTLTNQLSKNHNLIYSLLYKRHLFQPFCSQPGFEHLSQNIETILQFLMTKLESKTTHPTVADVQEIIKEGVMHLPRERIKKLADLRFRYVEESEPEEFFIPYVWTLVYRSSLLYWNQSKITLFETKISDKT